MRDDVFLLQQRLARVRYRQCADAAEARQERAFANDDALLVDDFARLPLGGCLMFRWQMVGYRNCMRTGAIVGLLLSSAILAAGCGGSTEVETTGASGEITFELDDVSDAKVAGVRATLTYENPDRTTIRIDGLDEGENAGGGANPVQLINGTCDDPGQDVFELENLSGSTSETTVDLGLVALQNGEYAVQVGLTQKQPEIVACGEVPQESPTEEAES